MCSPTAHIYHLFSEPVGRFPPPALFKVFASRFAYGRRALRARSPRTEGIWMSGVSARYPSPEAAFKEGARPRGIPTMRRAFQQEHLYGLVLPSRVPNFTLRIKWDILPSAQEYKNRLRKEACPIRTRPVQQGPVNSTARRAGDTPCLLRMIRKNCLVYGHQVDSAWSPRAGCSNKGCRVCG